MFRRLVPPKVKIFAGLGLLAVLSVLWLFQGLGVVRGLASSDKLESFVSQELDRLRQVPEAAAILARLEAKQEIRALAASAHAAYETEGASGLRRLVEQIKSDTQPCGMSLSRLAVQEDRFQGAAEREGFVIAHATACEALASTGGATATDGYLKLLGEEGQRPEVWPVVRDDPAALVLWPLIGGDPALWSFYLEQRDWLAEALVEFQAVRGDRAGRPDPGGDAAPEPALGLEQATPTDVGKAVTAAYLYHPLPRQAVVDEGLGGVGLSLFLDHGPVLHEAVTRLGLPLSETLEVLFTNGEIFAQPEASKTSPQELARQTAAALAHIYQTKPSVWKSAKQHFLALRLNRDVPQHADELLEKYGADDIGMFLYASFANEIPTAAAAVARFGDLAIYILNRYSDDERLRLWLRDPRVGVRIIPFLARFQDEGLDRVEARLDWLDRYFNKDGTPKEDDYRWLEGVPLIGGPANVIKHWSRGEPCEWSELGWAALDVADSALLVMSFGGSSAWTAARSGARATAAKQFVRGSGRTAARAAGLGARQAARTAVKRSALRTLIAAGARPAFWAGRGLRGAGNAAARAWEAAKAAKTAWASVPPQVRLWTYRGLLAVGLFVTLQERTIPKLPELGEALGELTGEVARQSTKAAGVALAAALGEMFAGNNGQLPRWAEFLVYGLVGVLFLTSALAYYQRLVRPRILAV